MSDETVWIHAFWPDDLFWLIVKHRGGTCCISLAMAFLVEGRYNFKAAFPEGLFATSRSVLFPFPLNRGWGRVGGLGFSSSALLTSFGIGWKLRWFFRHRFYGSGEKLGLLWALGLKLTSSWMRELEWVAGFESSVPLKISRNCEANLKPRGFELWSFFFFIALPFWQGRLGNYFTNWNLHFDFFTNFPIHCKVEWIKKGPLWCFRDHCFSIFNFVASFS